MEIKYLIAPKTKNNKHNKKNLFSFLCHKIIMKNIINQNIINRVNNKLLSKNIDDERLTPKIKQKQNARNVLLLEFWIF